MLVPRRKSTSRIAERSSRIRSRSSGSGTTSPKQMEREQRAGTQSSGAHPTVDCARQATLTTLASAVCTLSAGSACERCTGAVPLPADTVWIPNGQRRGTVSVHPAGADAPGRCRRAAARGRHTPTAATCSSSGMLLYGTRASLYAHIMREDGAVAASALDLKGGGKYSEKYSED
jgi:hypothetical protein